ncbi:hypothetical protein L208DRAFT_1396197 [Tricholoma matsutake]|nr:hypothetical protein L208DRAFT_1396197 [Tricholoma matsutake 945]
MRLYQTVGPSSGTSGCITTHVHKNSAVRQSETAPHYIETRGDRSTDGGRQIQMCACKTQPSDL